MGRVKQVNSKIKYFKKENVVTRYKAEAESRVLSRCRQSHKSTITAVLCTVKNIVNIKLQ